MSDQVPEWAHNAAEEGSREAVAWVLRLLDPGAASAAGDLLGELRTMDLARAEVLLSQMVRLTAEVAVRTGDMEKLQVVLLALRRG